MSARSIHRLACPTTSRRRGLCREQSEERSSTTWQLPGVPDAPSRGIETTRRGEHGASTPEELVSNPLHHQIPTYQVLRDAVARVGHDERRRQLRPCQSSRNWINREGRKSACFTRQWWIVFEDGATDIARIDAVAPCTKRAPGCWDSQLNVDWSWLQ